MLRGKPRRTAREGIKEGAIAFLFKRPSGDLAHNLFYALLGAIVAAFAHILKK